MCVVRPVIKRKPRDRWENVKMFFFSSLLFSTFGLLVFVDPGEGFAWVCLLAGVSCFVLFLRELFNTKDYEYVVEMVGDCHRSSFGEEIVNLPPSTKLTSVLIAKLEAERDVRINALPEEDPGRFLRYLAERRK